jgi:signal transduction histidine kinase
VSIRVRFIIIITLFGLLLTAAAGAVVWNATGIARQVKVIGPSVEYLHEIAGVRSRFYRQLHSLGRALILGRAENRRDFERQSEEVLAALERLRAPVLAQQALGLAGEDDDLNGITAITMSYREFQIVAGTALEERRRGRTAAAVEMMGSQGEVLVDYVLHPEIESALHDEVEEISTAYDEILMRLGAMPWAARASLGSIKEARSSVRYLLAVAEVDFVINRQMKELLDYLVTGSEENESQFREFGARVETAFQECFHAVEAQIGLGLRGDERLEEIKSLKEEYLKLLRAASRVFALRAGGRTDLALARLERDVIPSIDRSVHPFVDRVMAAARAEIDVAHGKMFRTALRSLIPGIIVVVLGAAALFFAVWKTLKTFHAAVEGLKRGSVVIGNGDLDHRIALPSKDELAEVAASFNTMAEKLAVSHATLRRKLDLEETLSRVSARFVGAASIDDAILSALAELGALGGAERAYFFRLTADEQFLSSSHEWRADGTPTTAQGLRMPVSFFPAWIERLRKNEIVMENISEADRTAPGETSPSALLLPVTVKGRLDGFVGFDRDAGDWAWEEDDLVLFRLFVQMLGRALEREQADEQVRAYAEELKLRNEELRSFMFSISHDLRTPLVNIKGFSAELSVMLRELDGLLHRNASRFEEEERQRLEHILQSDVSGALGFIEGSVDVMSRLMSAVLKLSRVSSRELRPERVDPGSVVHSFIRSRSGELAEKNITITVGPLPAVFADRLAIEQILEQLLDNAVLYRDPARPGTVTVEGERTSGGVTVRIRDNGRGIAAEDVPKVFEIFRRAGRQDTPGEGMGLVYVKTLVQRHGGSIWCESEPGSGSTFSFTIPDRGPSSRDGSPRADAAAAAR